MERRKLLTALGMVGASTTAFGGVASAHSNKSQKNNEKKPDKKVESKRPIFIVQNDELKIHPSIKKSTEADTDHLEKKFNEWLDNGVIETKQPSSKSESNVEKLSDKSTFVVPKQAKAKKNTLNSLNNDYGGSPISFLSHGQNSFSNDISTWGTPWDTHRVKLDSENSYTLENLLIVGGTAQAFASFLAGALGGPIGYALGALSIALAGKLALTGNAVEEARDGHGIEFLFRYSDGCIDFEGLVEYCIYDSYAEQFAFAYVTFLLSDLESQ